MEDVLGAVKVLFLSTKNTIFWLRIALSVVTVYAAYRFTRVIYNQDDNEARYKHIWEIWFGHAGVIGFVVGVLGATIIYKYLERKLKPVAANSALLLKKNI